MCDHSICVLYSLSSGDLWRTSRKSYRRPVLGLLHVLTRTTAPSLHPWTMNWTILTNFSNSGTAVKQTPREENPSLGLLRRQMKRETKRLVRRMKNPSQASNFILYIFLNVLNQPYCKWIFSLLTAGVDRKVFIVVISFLFLFYKSPLQVVKFFTAESLLSLLLRKYEI